MIVATLFPLFLAGALAFVQGAATVPIGNTNVLEVPAYQILAKYNEIKRSQPWLTLLPSNLHGEVLPFQQDAGFDYRGLRGKRVSRLAQLNVQKNMRDFYE
uniref:Uncharacterized protein n=1 Tax=Plectus sambesii TaxID=2011161 RepID=A0A914XP92_9BILA